MNAQYKFISSYVFTLLSCCPPSVCTAGTPCQRQHWNVRKRRGCLWLWLKQQYADIVVLPMPPPPHRINIRRRGEGVHLSLPSIRSCWLLSISDHSNVLYCGRYPSKISLLPILLKYPPPLGFSHWCSLHISKWGGGGVISGGWCYIYAQITA